MHTSTNVLDTSVVRLLYSARSFRRRIYVMRLVTAAVPTVICKSLASTYHVGSSVMQQKEELRHRGTNRVGGRVEAARVSLHTEEFPGQDPGYDDICSRARCRIYLKTTRLAGVGDRRRMTYDDPAIQHEDGCKLLGRIFCVIRLCNNVCECSSYR